MTSAKYITASAALSAWTENVLANQPPVLYPVGSRAIGQLQVGPGLVTLIGGAPGAGKTAFTMQCGIDALRLNPSLRALVCNVEMPVSALLDRQLARLSGVDLHTIQMRQIQPEQSQCINQALCTLQSIAERLCFVQPPFDMENIASVADDFNASLLVLDYIQRISPDDNYSTRRGEIDALMNYLRRFADLGIAVVVVSALSRTKDTKGRSSYDSDGLNLASFRESSELEYGADDAFILCPDDDDDQSDRMLLKHVKSRYGQCQNLQLIFDRPYQHFSGEFDMPQECCHVGAGDADGQNSAANQQELGGYAND